jgi:hypothetical protein
MLNGVNISNLRQFICDNKRCINVLYQGDTGVTFDIIEENDMKQVQYHCTFKKIGKDLYDVQYEMPFGGPGTYYHEKCNGEDVVKGLMCTFYDK